MKLTRKVGESESMHSVTEETFFYKPSFLIATQTSNNENNRAKFDATVFLIGLLYSE